MIRDNSPWKRNAFVDASGEANLTALANGNFILAVITVTPVRNNDDAYRRSLPHSACNSNVVQEAIIKAKKRVSLTLTKEYGDVFRGANQRCSLIHADENFDEQIFQFDTS